MADALSGLLAGLNQGVQTGLQLYQVVEGQKRAQRQEDRQAALDAVEQQRYAGEQVRQAKLDQTADDHWDQTFKFNTDKMEATNKLAAAKMRQDAAVANDASKRGWASVSQASRRNDLAAQKQQATSLKGYVAELGAAAADPNRGMDATVELMNGSPTHRMAAVTKLQQLGLIGKVAPDVVGRMTLVPAGDGRYAIGLAGDDGSVSPYDPDGADGPQKAVTIPQTMLQRAFGGQNAVDAGDAKTALGQGQATVENRVSNLGAQARSLSGALATQQQNVEKAQFAKEFETEGPRAEFLRQQETARADAEVGFDGTRTYTDPSTGQKVTEQPGMGMLLGTAKTKVAEREHQASLSQADGNLNMAQMAADTTQRQLATVPGQAQSLMAAGERITQQVRDLPVKDRAKATRDAFETLQVNPMLAERYPLKSPKEATELFTKDRNALVDRVVGAVDLKTQTDFKGKPEALAGGKANLRAVLLSMPPEMQLTLNDYTGQMEGALQKAAQGAADIGKPEAIIYNLYADKLGIDSQQTVALMQDKALWSVKDPTERFKLAARAMDMTKNGEASSVEAALGKVLLSSK